MSYCSLGIFRSAVRIVRYTHRHPANIALHCAGLPTYVTGIAIILGIVKVGLPQGACMIVAGISACAWSCD